MLKYLMKLLWNIAWLSAAIVFTHSSWQVLIIVPLLALPCPCDKDEEVGRP